MLLGKKDYFLKNYKLKIRIKIKYKFISIISYRFKYFNIGFLNIEINIINLYIYSLFLLDIFKNAAYINE